jgi:hypothetical protein
MRINKITPGFVVQTWDTELNRWIGQEFVAGDQTEFEAADTDRILDSADIWPERPEPYLPFQMTQPNEAAVVGAALFVLEIFGDLEPQLHGPYATEEARDRQAVQLRRQDPGKRNGLFRLNVTTTTAPDVGPYSGAELSDPLAGNQEDK